jgi:hypothetical protein
MHDKQGVYKQIMDSKYGSMDGVAIGQSVEDAVLKSLAGQEIVTVETTQLDNSHRHQSYHQKTMEAVQSLPPVIYQPSFVSGDLFCKCDLLVLNPEGQYDLREVKAKNSVRKKTKAAPLLDDMLADISFQHTILTEVLGDKYS